MTITPETAVVGVSPRISRDRFVALLAGSPVPVDEARESYEAVAARGVDPLFALAVFRHESQFGTQGICAKYGTRNPGNTRTPRMMDFPVIQTERGQFVRYPTWVDGFADAAFRLIDPAFVYAQRGLRAIGQIIPVWAPAEDANDPDGYVASVCRLMNTWQEDMTMRDPQAIWTPSSNFNKGRPGPVLGITDHITQGTSSLAWLRGAAGGSSNRGSSATYLIERDGTMYQLVDELDTPWTDGNLAYNQRRITIEHEGFSGQPLTPAQITASAGLHRRIAERHGFPLDRAHVIGHYQVPDPNNPALFGGLQHHLGCPGDAFPWDQILGSAPVDRAATVPPLDKLYHPTGAYMRGGFMAWWLSLNPDQMNLRVFGWAKTLEFVAQLPSQPQPFTYQVGERSTVTWRGGNLPPWDIYLVTPDEDAEAREYARANGLFA